MGDPGRFLGAKEASLGPEERYYGRRMIFKRHNVCIANIEKRQITKTSSSSNFSNPFEIGGQRRILGFLRRVETKNTVCRQLCGANPWLMVSCLQLPRCAYFRALSCSFPCILVSLGTAVPAWTQRYQFFERQERS